MSFIGFTVGWITLVVIVDWVIGRLYRDLAKLRGEVETLRREVRRLVDSRPPGGY